MVSELLAKISLARVSLAGQTLTWEERVWSNSHQAFVWHTQRRASNEVGVNINWDAFCKGRSSLSLNSMPKKATTHLHLSLTQLTRQEILGVLETR